MHNDTPERARPRQPLDHDPAKLRRRRVETGLTAKELASRVECSASHLSELESGTRNPSPPLLSAIAEALGCKSADLMPDAKAAA
jgi:transcriptional regulator with XRE-family HTH domain